MALANVQADPKRPVKAIVGALVTLLGLFWSALAGRDDLANMTVNEWLAIIVPTILSFAAIYGFANPIVTKPAANKRV